jgi:membrane fusion protein (multidrug efflux system)
MPPPPPAYEPAEAVQIVQARQVPWQRTADLVGTVLALRSVAIRNELGGLIRTVHFQSGDVVEAGQVLVTQDDSTDRAELTTAEARVRVATASISVAEARLTQAKSEADRIRSASNTAGAVSGMDVDRAATEVVQATAEIERLRAELDEAKARVSEIRTRLEKYQIRAPFKGRVSIRTVHEGQYLAQQMGMETTPITTLQETGDKVYLDFAIPQEYVSRVAAGTVVMATSPVLGPNPVPITVAALDSSVNNETRNIRVRTLVDNSNDRLRPGMFVQVRVPVDDPEPVVVVPATAIRRSSYADQVFLIVPDKSDAAKLRATLRFVKVGASLGEDVVVTSGLAPGDRLAAVGSFKLREGALVMAAEPSPARPASGTQAAKAPSATPAAGQ